MSRILLIANPDSGSADDADVPELLAGAGAEVEELPIERADEARGTDAERIVVAGGDGSIAPAAEAAVAAGVELAVVPCGTANDFADRMGLPQELGAAIELAARGERTRAVDLARVADRPFVNLASLGLSPAAADRADELKGRLGALAYTVGALRAAGSERPVRCRIECEGGDSFDQDAWQAMVGCTGAFGGGSRIEADADDGRLDVVAIEGGPRATLAKYALGLRSGSVESQKGVWSRRCAAVEIRLREEQELNIDGELVASGEIGGLELRFTIEPQALRLVIP